MYVTTFYSYKGGVGRTMALVNSGLELARKGRRVLLVDFDLEAPGLDSFDCLKPSKSTPGVVDFVDQYSETNQAPDVQRFVAKCPKLIDLDGELLLMPAGASKSSYAESFRRIDWEDLYERKNGFLLFEELKAQWREVLRPDYVLIDSRTGHTDVGDICTRQLPDAVAILFFPNEQNLAGLTKVVSDIRSETKEPRRKQIHLHFVMSNVPDFDDEDRILDRKIAAFQKKLAFESDPLIIHRYNSLSLLNQVVFTKDRPSSRLAGEYRQVVKDIVRRNLRDREGALDYLRSAARAARFKSMEFEPPQESEIKLSEIGNYYEDDGEVLFHLGLVRQDDGQMEQAATLFGRAILKGYTNTEAHLHRARALKFSDQPAEASAEALKALHSDWLSPRSIRQALRLVAPSQYENAANSPAIASLETPERIELVHDLFFESASTREVAMLILKTLFSDSSLIVVSHKARNSLALVYIAIARFDLAVGLLSHAGSQNVDIATAFNYAMALWGQSGKPDPASFRLVVDLHEANVGSNSLQDANFLQCIALAYWAVGDSSRAIEYAGQAADAVRSLGLTFSFWCYRNVRRSKFRDDLKEMVELFEGSDLIVPAFLTEKSS